MLTTFYLEKAEMQILNRRIVHITEKPLVICIRPAAIQFIENVIVTL